MDAVNDFRVALREVEILLLSTPPAASDGMGDGESVLIKSALLLLAAKVECFLEAVLEEYCARWIGVDINSIPKAIKLHASRNIFMNSAIAENEFLEENKAEAIWRSITSLWSGSDICSALQLDTKLAFGKHGEKEVCRMFKRIGLGDVFNQCKIEDESDSMAVSGSAFSVAGDFNSLINLRNNIIHTDATPSLTRGDVSRYTYRMMAFALKLDVVLSAHFPSGDILAESTV